VVLACTLQAYQLHYLQKDGIGWPCSWTAITGAGGPNL
jgi:hypothetical protein